MTTSVQEEATPAALKQLLDRQSGRIHMVGIGGVGMAGVAIHLQSLGMTVSGCDQEQNVLHEKLSAQGISCCIGHDADHIHELDLVIFTPAMSPHHPELVAARQAGIPLLRRGKALPLIQEQMPSIAVSGTHGKTTTSSLITAMLEQGDLDVGYCIGGLYHGNVARPGKDWLVLEADESDGTLSNYASDYALVTNIEYDHMEHFQSEAAFFEVFRAFCDQAEQGVFYCADDPHARKIAGVVPGSIGYGLSEHALIRGSVIKEGSEGSVFGISADIEELGELSIPVPGRHNLLNALGAVAVALELGCSLQQIQQGLTSFTSPKRRFETLFRDEAVQLISDYAHHPSEIKAVLQAALLLDARRTIAVYQPHRYTRTLALGAAFPSAFEGLDHLVMAPVYAASEEPIPGGTSEDLVGRFDKSRHVPVQLTKSLDHAYAVVKEMIRPGDLVLVLGAGDVEKIGFRLKADLEQSPLDNV